MRNINLLFEASPWFIVICLIAGLGYAAALYYHTRAPWGRRFNYLLFTLRFLLTFLIALLLLGPLVKQVYNTYEKPTVVIGVDNSQSISEVRSSEYLNELLSSIRDLSSQLKSNDYQVEVRLLDGNALEEVPDSIPFQYDRTNVSQLLDQIRNDYESRNLSQVIFLSDGIYNIGMNPAFRPYPYQIHTVGIGDTTKRPDININSLRYNKIAYQGNKFPILAEIFTNGFANTAITLQMFHDGKIIDERTIQLTDNREFIEAQFEVEAEEKGYQQYTVKAVPLDDEVSVANNEKDAFIDVIEGKERILIAASFPHPDIKALSTAIESNKNYEVQTYIDGIDEVPAGNEPFDVYILHQLPNINNKMTTFLNRIKQDNSPVWFISGNRSNIAQLNNINNLARIIPINRQKDEVFAHLNTSFNTFNYTPENESAIGKYPPVSVPFANYNINPVADILLYQRVGTIETKKPLLLVGRTDQGKQALMIGDGMWQWRLSEFAQTEQTVAFDELVTKTIQFLSARDDRRKFKVFPVKDKFTDNEPVIFEAEVYNDIYERIYGQTINIRIHQQVNESDVQGYQFVTSKANSRYRINELEPGIYNYKATSEIEGDLHSAEGTFVVENLQIENTMLTADHNLLRTLASKNAGQYYNSTEFEDLIQNMTVKKAQSVIHSNEDYLSIINVQWLFFLLLILVSVEWFMRKYMGSY